MPSVSSSAIRKIEYDPDTQRMYVTFKGSGTYTFCRVPQSVYERFIHAGSKGTFYNNYIKDRYSC